MQIGGNLVLNNNYDSTQWSTNTNLIQPRLVMNDNGNLVLYNLSNQTFWSSNSSETVKKFKNQAVNKCLESNANGGVVCITCSNSNYQNWVEIKYKDGYSTLMNKANGFYLSDSGNLVSTKAKDGSINQDWLVTGTRIQNRATNKAILANVNGNVYSISPLTGIYQNWNQI